MRHGCPIVTLNPYHSLAIHGRVVVDKKMEVIQGIIFRVVLNIVLSLLKLCVLHVSIRETLVLPFVLHSTLRSSCWVTPNLTYKETIGIVVSSWF